jgi:hypothetical protein
VATTRCSFSTPRWARQGISGACCLGLLALLAACTPSGPGSGRAHAAKSSPSVPVRDANVVTRDRYAGHVEPDVAINPRDPQNLLGACQFEVGSRTRLPGTFATFDGGRTWIDSGLLPLPAGYEQGADTTVAFDGQGTGFVVALMSHGGGGYPSRVSRGGIFLWRTANGGRSFGKPVPVYVGPGFQDHPWLAISPSSPASLFIAWTNNRGLEFTVSRDGAASFLAPQLLVPGNSPSNPVITVGYRDSVHVFYEDYAGPSQLTRLFVVSSTDGGQHFSAAGPVGSAPAPPSAGGGPKGNASLPPPLLGAASDPGSTRGAVAISGQDTQAGHPVIYLWQYSAHGRGWQGPGNPVTGAGAAVTQVQPRMIYIRHRLYMSYFAITRSGQISERIVHQTASGGFQRQTLGNAPFLAGGFIGDYQALASTRETAYALWNETQSGRLEIVAGTFSAR